LLKVKDKGKGKCIYIPHTVLPTTTSMPAFNS